MNRIIISFLIALSVFTSCDSYLEQLNPNKITSDTFFKTEEDFLQALAATYTPLRNPRGGYYNVRAIQLRNFRSDDVLTRNDNESLYQIYLFTNSPNNAEASGVFMECYSAIYRANTLLEKIKESGLSDDFKKQVSESFVFKGHK